MRTIKLFMFYIGGDHANANIELHDVRFCAGESASACYEDLRKQWWGRPESLHIDSWAEISHADGYDISISVEPFKGREKLFFLNLGGYSSGEFEEVHKNILVVAESQRKAIQKAIPMVDHWRLPHKDTLMEIEKAISLSLLMKNAGFNVHINPSDIARPLTFISRYIRLNK